MKIVLWQYVSIGSGDGLAWIRKEAITWINNNQVYTATVSNHLPKCDQHIYEENEKAR